MVLPKILVIGHSFVKRLNTDISKHFDSRTSPDFALSANCQIVLHGYGGRTVTQLRDKDCRFLSDLSPDVVIMDIGTNDLSSLRPEVVGSAIEEFVSFIRSKVRSVRSVGVCLVIPRSHKGTSSPLEAFNSRAAILNNYLRVVLEDIPGVFVWEHRKLCTHAKAQQFLLIRDGVHLNPHGQYVLYRSYRGAILRALSLL